MSVPREITAVLLTVMLSASDAYVRVALLLRRGGGCRWGWSR
jgi:hypothetical protein